MHCGNMAEKMSDNNCLERLGLSQYKRHCGESPVKGRRWLKDWSISCAERPRTGTA